MNAKCSSGRRFAMAVLAAAAALLAVSGGTAPRQPRIETGPDAEVTHDGLYRVQRTVMDAAWVKPDLDLTGYTKLMLGTGGISYKKLKSEAGAGRSSQTEFPVQEENKARLQQIFREEMLEEFEKLERYEIVSAPGPDVLLLVGVLIDVVSEVPPDVSSARYGRGGVFMMSVGEATLVLELRDSESNEVLARAADRRSAESAHAFEVDSVTAWVQVRNLAKSWARLLRSRLEEINGV